ncbi:MAG: DUF5666 domain-containing protein [Candidatus Acidiferrales bacterium]|jgi:hypothetical protein
MPSEISKRASCLLAVTALVAFAILPEGAIAGSVPAFSQAPTIQAAQAPARQLGTIKAIKGDTIRLTTDVGGEIDVVVEETTRIVRVEPGQKDLKGATVLPFKDLQVGDRILVRGQPSADGKTFTAAGVIAMKHVDLEAKQQHEREDWQWRGIGGLVSAVDPAAGIVTISIGLGATATNVAVHTTKDTVIRRYAPDSVKFDDAKPSTLDAIRPGDQLRARGSRSANGKGFAAEEIVNGSFRNIAGTISSIDVARNTVTVMDAIRKQSTVVKISAESQVRKLPPEMAQRIAMRLKAAAGEAAGTPGGNAAAAGQAQAPAAPNSGGAGGPRPGGGPDLQQVLNRMPRAALADLQKGDAVMIVSTEGGASGQVTAITLLAGVEPILTVSPQGTQAMTLSPWALGGGSAEAGADANP